MSNLLSRKRLVFITVIALMIVTAGLYTSYAINSSSEVGMSTGYDMSLNFDLSDSLDMQITVPAGKTKVFDIDIKNNYNDAVTYGVTYSMVNPSTLPDGVTVEQNSSSKNSSDGTVNANSNISVTVTVTNGSSSNVTLSFSVINGYKNGGDLIVPSGKIHVPSKNSSSKALATLTNLGLTKHINDTELTTFTSGSNEDGTTGIYKTQDDIGDSYYFRGNVDYNYVKFGKYTTDVYSVFDWDTYTLTYEATCPSGEDCIQIASANDDMYWRIVRINGDGTIRMIYAGTDAYANNEYGVIRHIGYTAYNYDLDDNAYVGYMYGTPYSSTYEATHRNTNNSTIKTMVDLWFDTYLESNYGQYIADAIYCNDRTKVTDSYINSKFGATGEGFDTYTTLYGYYGRMTLTEDGIPSSYTPTLKCEQENDRFTKESSVSGVIGNDVLTNPVGLITADELNYAGAIPEGYNEEMYLYDDHYFWTMSPNDFSGGSASVFNGEEGAIGNRAVDSGSRVARPAISLSSSVQLTGQGTTISPFEIST